MNAEENASGNKRGGKKDKKVVITVNTDDHTVPHRKITYDEVVELAYPGGSSGGALYIIKYSRGSSGNISGKLPAEGKVMVKDGMLFRVSPTGES